MSKRRSDERDSQPDHDSTQIEEIVSEAIDAVAHATSAQEAVSEDSRADCQSTSLADELRLAQDRALRSQAELENFRKRMRRQMEDERQYAVVPLVRDLLNVMDNLERAIDASRQSDDASGLRDGVQMVATQLKDVLQGHDCQAIQAVGIAFDPHQHEALAQVPSDEYPAGVVCQETRVGYRLHDRVVRPSQVFVSSGPAATPDTTSSPS